MKPIADVILDIMAGWPMETLIERKEQLIEAFGLATYEEIIRRATK